MLAVGEGLGEELADGSVGGVVGRRGVPEIQVDRVVLSADKGVRVDEERRGKAVFPMRLGIA